MYQGLQEMLNYEGSDFEDVFMQSFQISYTGTDTSHDVIFLEKLVCSLYK